MPSCGLEHSLGFGDVECLRNAWWLRCVSGRQLSESPRIPRDRAATLGPGERLADEAADLDECCSRQAGSGEVSQEAFDMFGCQFGDPDVAQSRQDVPSQDVA